MIPLCLAMLGALLFSAAALAEGSYSNAPASHDQPPPAVGQRYQAPGNKASGPLAPSRVPVDAVTDKPSAGASPQAQGTDAAPFAGVPDVSNEPDGNSPPPPPVTGMASQPGTAATTSPPEAPPRAPSGPPTLVEAFSTEQNPGQGALDYTRGGSTERIDFGPQPGHYAMGMLFRGEYLPDQLGQEFKQKNVFQIEMGTLRSRLQGQTPQFGSLSIIADGMIEFSTRYLLKMPSGQSGRPETGGLLLFTSPNTPVEQSDEEKLKSTYFAQSGTLLLTPEGKPRIVDVRAQGKRLTYRMQLMKLDIKARLVTPFNATEAGLSGTIEFPVYYSEDRAGDQIAKQIARESFGVAGSILDNPTDWRREPASKKKKKARKKRRRED